MSDLTILLYGCAVTFIAGAGAYVILRERFMGQDSPRTIALTQRSRSRSRLQPGDPVPVQARR